MSVTFVVISSRIIILKQSRFSLKYLAEAGSYLTNWVILRHLELQLNKMFWCYLEFPKSLEYCERLLYCFLFQSFSSNKSENTAMLSTLWPTFKTMTMNILQENTWKDEAFLFLIILIGNIPSFIRMLRILDRIVGVIVGST